jgi:hypothetical protein
MNLNVSGRCAVTHFILLCGASAALYAFDLFHCNDFNLFVLVAAASCMKQVVDTAKMSFFEQLKVLFVS